MTLAILTLSSTLGILSSTYFSERFLRKDAEERMGLWGKLVEDNVHDWLEQSNHLLEDLATDPAIVSMDPAKQKVHLKNTTKIYKDIYLLHTVDLTGMNVARSDEAPPKSYADRQYIKTPLDGGPITSQVVTSKTHGRPAIALAASIRDPNGKVLGAVAFAAELTSLAKTLGDTHFGNTGFSYVVDADGKMIIQPTRKVSGQPGISPSEVSLKAFIPTEKGFVEFLADDSGMLTTTGATEKWFAHSQIFPNHWRLITLQKSSEVFAEARQILIVGIFIFLGSLAVTALITWIFIYRALKPLSHLTQTVSRFGEGDLTARFTSNTENEIRVLGRSFNKMASDIQNSFLKIETQEMRLLEYQTQLQEMVDEKVAELDVARAQLIHSAKLSSLGEMASSISHEINNPLSIIIGLVGRLKRQIGEAPNLPANWPKDIDTLLATSNRIAAIIRGLKSLSRNAEGDPFVKTELATIVNDSIDLCAERFKSHGVTLVVADTSGFSLECRATQISQILVNLLNNAFDAVMSLDEKWVRLDATVRDHSHLVISVTDSGKGISKELAEKLMQPFFTTKGVNLGTGLGLSISRRIAHDHGGKFYFTTASSEPGASVNTSFILELPIKQGQR